MERKDKERTEIIKNEFEREINKIKKKSTANAQGGWGTFSIVFEDNPKKHHPLVMTGQIGSNSLSQISNNAGRRKGSILSIESGNT